MAQDEPLARCRVIIHGRVQGVCFRLNTVRAATRIGVTGWVKNRPEGTVEAVFEGGNSELERIVEWCRVGDPPASVSEIELTREESTGEFPEFTITY